MAQETEYNKTHGLDPVKQRHISWVDGTTETADYSPTAIDVSDYDNGSIHVSWSSYDGTNGAVNIQGSTDGTNWEDDSGLEGALTDIEDTSGSVMFRLTDIGYDKIRFRFYLGSGSTVTLSASYLFKTRRA